MRIHWCIVPVALGALVLAPARDAAAATYRGHSVDHLRYQGSVLNPDYGQFDDVELRFHGDQVFVYFRGGGRMVLNLEDEEITDAHRIPAHDLRRGVTWEVNAKDLGPH